MTNRDAWSRTGSRRNRPAAWAAAAATTLLLAATAWVSGPVAPVTAADAGFQEIGQVPFRSADPTADSRARALGTIILDPAARRGIRLISDGAQKFTLSAFDLDSFAAGPSKSYDGGFTAAGSQSASTATPHVIGGGKLYLAERSGPIWVFDAATLQRLEIFPGPLGAQSSTAPDINHSPGYRKVSVGELATVGSLAYAPATATATAKLLVLTETVGAAPILGVEPPNEVSLSVWDAKTGQEELVERLTACRNGRGVANSKYGMGLAARPKGDKVEVSFGCIGRGGTGEVWRLELNAARTAVENPTLAGAVPTAVDFYNDLAGGRMTVQTNSGLGQTFVGVDLDRRGVYGALQTALENDSGAPDSLTTTSGGIDPTTGRLYAFAAPTRNSSKTFPGGVVMTDTRRSPLPQGLNFADLNPEGRAGGGEIVVDPARPGKAARVFIRLSRPRGTSTQTANFEKEAEPFYRVFEDRIPLQRDVALGDIDALTANVDEREGQTVAGFTAGASSFGFRQILVGGYAATPDPLGYQAGQSVTKDILYAQITNPCLSSDRSLTLAAILTGTTLSDTGGSGVAAGAVADPRTVQDLAAPTGSCPSTPSFMASPVPPGTTAPADGTAGQKWNFSTVVCNPGDNEPPPPTDDEGFQAGVTCSKDGRQIEAWATAKPQSGTMPFQQAKTSTILRRLIGGGVQVATESTVDGIGFPGVVSIGSVRSRAVSESRGRPGTAKVVSFSREWCGVAGEPGCLDPDTADGQARIADMNKGLAARDYRLEAPKFDADLSRGTPGGVLSGLQKDRFNAIGDRLLNNDDSSALPAMQLIHLHDSGKGRGRQVYQFAAVETSTAYFISLLSDSGSDEPDLLDVLPVGPEQFDEGAPEASPDLPVDADLPPTSHVEHRSSPRHGLAALIYAIRRTLALIVRDPLAALSMFALIFAAFGMPIHLAERRRALRSGVGGGPVSSPMEPSEA